MEVGKENINIGLTKDEFELVINNSHNPELIKKYVHKLDNCDLSKSAIELIREEDLDTINRITNEILLKYPVISNKDGNVKWLIGGIALLILFAGIVLFKKETADNSTPNQTILNEKIKEDNSEDSLFLDINVNNAPLTLNPLDSLHSLYWDWKISKYFLNK